MKHPVPFEGTILRRCPQGHRWLEKDGKLRPLAARWPRGLKFKPGEDPSVCPGCRRPAVSEATWGRLNGEMRWVTRAEQLELICGV